MNSSSQYLNLHRPSYSIDLNQGQQQQQLYDHQILLHRHSFSTFESHSPPIYSNPVQDDQLGSYLYMGSSPYHEQEVGGSYGSGSYDQTTLERKEAKGTKLKFTICKKEEQTSGGGDDEINSSNVKWLPLRIMKNLMRGDEDDQKHQLMSKTLKGDSRNMTGDGSGGGCGCNNNENNSAIRVCSDCNTTKTPLWRSGPRGPKSLCNACGIRQRKARRAMAMADGSTPPSVMKAGNGHKKTANNNNNMFGGHKKRSKVVKPSRDNNHYNAQRKLCFEEFALNLSKKLSVQQVFPQEEKEAAILLMALSCGFVHG